MKKLLLLMTIISLPSYSEVSANVSFTSDYIWRGMTQSDGPAIQGGFDYASEGGFYAGIWGSNVNFNDGAGSELDYYFGYGFEIKTNDIIYFICRSKHSSFPILSFLKLSIS